MARLEMQATPPSHNGPLMGRLGLPAVPLGTLRAEGKLWEIYKGVEERQKGYCRFPVH